MCFSFLELTPLNFWVDEPQDISSDVVAESFFFDVRVTNKMKLMLCIFILKNFINCTDESRTASGVKDTSFTPNRTYSLAISTTLWAIMYLSASVWRMPFVPVCRWAISILSFVSFSVGWICWWKCFDVAVPKKQHLQFAVLSQVFKFRIFISLVMLSPKMLLLILDGILLSLSEWSRFVAYCPCYFHLYGRFYSYLSHCSLTLIQRDFVQYGPGNLVNINRSSRCVIWQCIFVVGLLVFEIYDEVQKSLIIHQQHHCFFYYICLVLVFCFLRICFRWL